MKSTIPQKLEVEIELQPSPNETPDITINISEKEGFMLLITQNFKWIMLVAGILTATMFSGLVAPQAALESMFGVSFDGQLQLLIVRSWSALIGLMGVVLIYGAFSETNRAFAASIAALSKAIFVLLIFTFGQDFIAQAAPAIILDVAVVVLTVIYLLALRNPK
jgi:hypothetical protein